MYMDKDIDVTISESLVPKYYMVKQALLKQLKAQITKPHQKLPTEKELTQHFQVSRITVRKALSELESEGYIYRIQGRGSFASDKFQSDQMKHHAKNNTAAHAYKYQIEAHGYQYKRQFVAARRVGCPVEEASLFGLEQRVSVLCIERAHFADDQVAIFVRSYLHPVKAAEVEQHNFITQSLLNAFQECFHADLFCEGRRVKIDCADAELAEFMNIEEKTPLLKYTYHTIISDDEEKVPIECATAWYRADIIEFLPDVGGEAATHHHHHHKCSGGE